MQTPEAETTTTPKPKQRPRGFAAMSPEKQREIASRGGKAAHAAGTAHEFTSDEGRIAGKKGGQTAAARRNAASRNGASR
jgi:general stress protein YciG